MLISFTFPTYLAATAANTPAQEDLASTVFIFGLAGVALWIGLWNLLIAVLGLFPNCQATAVGTLVKANTKINYRTRHGYIIPRFTHYAYIYTANGKPYCYQQEMHHSKRRLLPKLSLVYVKGFPRHAYPNKFTGTSEWILGFCMLFVSTLLIYVLSTSS